MTPETRRFKTECEALEAYGDLRRQAVFEVASLPREQWIVAGKVLCPKCYRTYLVDEEPELPCRACIVTPDAQVRHG